MTDTAISIVHQPFPLSSAQRGLWFAQQLAPDVPICIAQYVDIRGPLDVDLFQQLALDVGHEYQSVFLRLVEVDGEPHQVFAPPADAAMGMQDFRSEPDPWSAAQAWMDENYSAPVDLVGSPLTESSLLRVADDRYLWYTRIHHIALDGYGAATMVDRVAHLYTAEVENLDAEPNRAAELTTLQTLDHDYRASLRYGVDSDYWAERLRARTEVVTLTDRNALPAARSLVARAALSDDTAALLDNSPDVAAARIIAGFACYLSRTTGRREVFVDLPVSARTTAVLRRSGGMLANVVPLRVSVCPDDTVGSLVGRVRMELVGALRHQRSNVEDIVRELDVTPGFRRISAPVVNVMLFSRKWRFGKCTADFHILTSGPVPDLLVNVYRAGTPSSTIVELRANPHRYRDDEVQAHHRRFVELIDAISVAASDTPLTAIGGVDVPLAVSGAAPEPDITLPDLFAAAVAEHPHAVAVQCGQAAMTYYELDAASNRVARTLLRTGVTSESVVAVSIPRSIESVLAVWSIAKTGAAFVPVDPKYPADRIEHMLTDSGASVGLSTAGTCSQLPSGVRWLAIDDEFDCSAAPITDTDRGTVHIEQAAYLVYTSGSTGLPKGVVVTHRGLANLVAEQRTHFGAQPNARVLHCASPSFDASVFEIVWAVGAGARLLVVPSTVYGGDELAKILVDATHAVLTPTVLATVPPAGPNPRLLAVAGEACPAELVDKWAPGRTMLNGYGPTESTVIANSAVIEAGERVTIGGPVCGTTEVVLDSRLRPVPVGVAGELYLAGPSLARGYRNRSALTATRFVADPLGQPGTRLYRTGDVVRWRRVANDALVLDYVGRADFQVKIRGIRVELGEIDAALTRHPNVAAAVTVGRAGPSGDTVPISYIVPTGGEPDIAEITARLRGSLPAHLVPATIVVLDELPVTPVGKLDRGALPAPVFGVPATRYRTPITATEHAVAAIFAEVLGVDRIGRDDNFFDVGGNSLSATRVVARANAAFGVGLGVRDLFQAPVVSVFSRCVDDARTGEACQIVTVEPRPERLPLSLAQQRMWIVNQLDTTSHAYNVPIVLRLTGTLDVDALRVAFADVVGRHEPLRTQYPSSPDGPFQQVCDAVEFDLAPRAVHGEEELRAELIRLATTGFDVSHQVPVRTAVLRIGPSEHVVAVIVHHIAADGSSMVPLARDVMLAYTARVGGQEPGWAPLPAQYADYAQWQRRLLGSAADPQSRLSTQLDFWQRTLAGMPELLELPTDRPRPAHRSHHGSKVEFTIGADLHRTLSALARKHDATLFMVVHAAFALLLERLTGTSHPTIGTPVAGRGAAQLDEMVGMFVNTVVLRADIDADLTFDDLIAHVRYRDLDAFSNTDVPFDQVVQKLDPIRSASHTPLFQVLLEFRNTETTRVELPGMSVESLDVDTEVAKCDLYLAISENTDVGGYPAGMDAEFGFATDLFDSSTVRTFTERFVRILEQVADGPGRPVGKLDVLGSAERDALVPVSGAAARAHITLPQLFGRSSSLDPAAVAVVDGARHLTYRNLDELSNRLARSLVAIGVGPESIVAVALTRSADSVIAMWAIAKAGAAFLPIDPHYPPARIAHMLEESGVIVGITIDRWRSSLPDAQWVALDSPEVDADVSSRSLAAVSDTDRVAPLHADHAAYVIYTSGSTGTPKGVVVTHTGLANLVKEQCIRFRLGPGARVLHFASPSFDAAVLEQLWALATGGRLVIAPPTVYGGAELAELIARERTTHIALTPSVLATLNPGGLGCVRTVVVGGEVCPPELVARWYAGRRMINTYGPAEATIQTNAGEPMAAGEQVTIGGPIRGVSELVLDARLRPVPTGVVGELYLSGPALARGYRNRRGATASRFVADPFGTPGRRMYRTGDLVRWRHCEDGALTLDYIGRDDLQVKVRGFRIELGEIESVLLDCPGVLRAVVTVHDDRLDGYVVAAHGAELEPAAVRAHAERRLAPHMVPATVTMIAAMPVTANGKLDRACLPAPDLSEGRPPYRGPRTTTETAITLAFGDALHKVGIGAAAVGIDDSYFALGGTSLTATGVAAALVEAVQRPVSVQWIFTHPTPESLARRIEEGSAAAETSLGVLLPLRETGAGSPLFCVHPAVGLAWCFAALASHAGDRPVYGLQSPMFTDPDRTFATLAELAGVYVDHIRSAAPQGPYHLLGYSVGGQIAHEIAAQLTAAGDEVATLTMLDTHLSHVSTPPSAELIAAEARDMAPADAVTAEQLDVVRRTFTRTVALAVAHTPTRIPVDLLFFESADAAANGLPSPTAAWRPHIGGAFQSHRIPVPHQQMTGPIALGHIGPALTLHLQKGTTS